jgi:hypothetical protein
MPGGLLVRVPRPTVETASVWVWVVGVAVALASPAVPLVTVTGHVAVAPGQALFRPARFKLEEVTAASAASAATSTGPSNHRGVRMVASFGRAGAGTLPGVAG